MTSTTQGPGTARWRKSSYSGYGDGGECIEVADGYTGIVPVRDSKDPHGPALLIPAGAWTEFVDALKAGGLRPRR